MIDWTRGRSPSIRRTENAADTSRRSRVWSGGSTTSMCRAKFGPGRPSATIPSLDASAAAQRAHPELRIEQFGDASVAKAMDAKIGDDFQRSEVLSLPITLAILIVTFGALVAAGLPLLLAITSVAASIGLTMVVSQFAPVSDSVAEVILLVGMAVGVDYSLFYMRREREERAAGASDAEALQTAANTSGRAVLVSGLTVMTAMAGMYLTGDKTFSSFATGTIIVVAVAMLGSVTVLPALLSKLGDRVEKGRIPGLHREEARDSRFWGWIVDRVMRRPLVTGGLATAAIPGRIAAGSAVCRSSRYAGSDRPSSSKKTSESSRS